jgi:hypothetical protein
MASSERAKAQPGIRIVGIRHHGLGVRARCRPRIGAGGQRLLGLRAQLARGLAAGLPVGTQISLVALGVGLHAAVGETLVLCMSNACAQDEREAEEHAESE